MSAYGFVFPLLRDPQGLANTVGAAHTRVRHVAGGAGKSPPCPYHETLRSPQPVKAKPSRFASQETLTGFASVRFG